MDEREKNLPKWAQETIKELRLRCSANAEPLARELAVLRPLIEKLRNENGALREILECASRGRHMNSQTVMDVLGSFSLQLVKDGGCPARHPPGAAARAG